MSDDLGAKLGSLKRKFEQLVDDVRMSGVTREVGDLDGTVRKLPTDVEQVRSRGYAYRSYLEHKIEVLADHWRDIRHRVERSIDSESDDLRGDFDEVEKTVEMAERSAGSESRLDSILPRMETAIERLEQKIKAAEGRVRDIYGTLKQDLSKTVSQIREINWIMDQKEEASFEFMAGEAVFLAAEAEWVASGKGKDDPDGNIYLTDQRLIFEQKEKVGKKLGLFGGKKVQEVEWEIPLHQVEGVEAENKGMFGGKDMLNFTLGSGAPYAKITVEVKGGADCKFWAKQIDRMISGGAEDERAIPPDPEMLEALRDAPTECHVCGATLPKIVAGQNQIDCAYCGSVVRI
jgi:archaellum component FlaC